MGRNSRYAIRTLLKNPAFTRSRSSPSRKIKGLRNHHLAGRAWKVERDMVAEHAPIILHRVSLAASGLTCPAPLRYSENSR
jgi:hypothetical protein